MYCGYHGTPADLHSTLLRPQKFLAPSPVTKSWIRYWAFTTLNSFGFATVQSFSAVSLHTYRTFVDLSVTLTPVIFTHEQWTTEYFYLD